MENCYFVVGLLASEDATVDVKNTNLIQNFERNSTSAILMCEEILVMLLPEMRGKELFEINASFKKAQVWMTE